MSKSIKDDLILAEYSSLKAEILVRAKFRFTLTTTALVGAGVFLGLENRYESVNEVLLIYPILLFFLATGWLYQLKTNLNINKHLQIIAKENDIVTRETMLPNEASQNGFNRLGTISQGWMFSFLQFMCLAVAFEDSTLVSLLASNLKCWLVIFLSFTSFICTLLVVWNNHKAKSLHQ